MRGSLVFSICFGLWAFFTESISSIFIEPIEVTKGLSFSLKSIPELSGLTKEEQKKLYRKCSTKVFQHWQAWLAIVGLGLWNAFCIYIVVSDILPIHFSIILSGLGGGFGWYVFNIVWVSMTRPYLKIEREVHCI